MRRFPPAVQAYIVAIIAGGGVVLATWFPRRIEEIDPPLLATLAVSGVLASLYHLPLAERHLRISLTGGILQMGIFLGTTAFACHLAAIVALLSGILLRRRLWNILFGVGARVLSVGLASSLYQTLADDALLPLDSWDNLLALYLAALGYWLLDSALVVVLISAHNNQPFRQNYLNNWREVYLQCILLTLLAVLGSAAWRQGPVYAFLLFVPAVALYQLLSITRSKQEQVIHAAEIIAEVLDRRDPFTFQHSRRVAEHTVKMARQLGLRDHAVDLLRRAALIHDIGKLGVDDTPGGVSVSSARLTEYQFYALKQHAQLGAMIAREIPAFEEAEQPIRFHHDWYDGSHVSRPHAGEEIPIGARIIALADVYDRLCMANGEASLACDPLAVEQLRAMAGRQLDPELVDLFVSLLKSERDRQPKAAAVARPVTG